MKDLVKLAIDVYRGSTGEFSAEQANEALRKSLIEINGGSDKLDYKAFRRNKVAIFEIIEEILDVLISEDIEANYEQFVEVRTLNFGDTNVFEVPDTKLFRVATISDGNGNLRRQRIDSGFITVETAMKGVKVYEEFARFLAGRISWQDMVDRVAKSFNTMIANDIHTSIYNSYNQLTATYGITGSYSDDQLANLIAHIEASTGRNAMIFGTKLALCKVAPAVVSDNMKDKYNLLGHYGVFQGTEMRELKQIHKPGTDTFVINDAFLLVVPVGGEKLCKLVLEGEAIIDENPGGRNADQSLEYLFQKKYGVATIACGKYGIYRLT